ncbi:MAG TPA: hypothetical protein VGS12_00780 [Caulobacteraceae bacterium]|nr:hypothetical protein [Caulobacteraceae bacterium]
MKVGAPDARLAAVEALRAERRLPEARLALQGLIVELSDDSTLAGCSWEDWRTLGMLARELGQNTELKNVLEKVAARSDWDPMAQIALLECLITDRQFAAAWKQHRAVAARLPTSTDTLWRLVAFYTTASWLDRVHQWWWRGLRRRSEDMLAVREGERLRALLRAADESLHWPEYRHTRRLIAQIWRELRSSKEVKLDPWLNLYRLMDRYNRRARNLKRFWDRKDRQLTDLALVLFRVAPLHPGSMMIVARHARELRDRIPADQLDALFSRLLDHKDGPAFWRDLAANAAGSGREGIAREAVERCLALAPNDPVALGLRMKIAGRRPA